MMRATGLLLVISALSGICLADSLNDGDFETAAAWAGATGSLTANAANASQWWYGSGTNVWIRQGKPGYAPMGQYCAGVMDGMGPSVGLLQFVPLNEEIKVTVDFLYLLWRGDFGETSARYGVYVWKEGDLIDLSETGPGPAATEILSGTLVPPPSYGGAGNPKDYFAAWSHEAPLVNSSQYDYIGFWIQYEIWGGSFYVDDVKLNLTPVPEPATLGLLAAGTVAIFFRRRR